MVTLGTWGNSDGMFKGFTSQPEEYQIRRLLKYTGTTPRTRVADDKSWDPIMEVPVKAYTDYVFNPRKSVPWNTSKITGDSGVQNSEIRLQTLIDNDYRFYKYLPYTSFDKTTNASVFGVDAQKKPIKMIPTNSSGWRNIGLKENGDESITYSLRYHRGFDVIPASGTGNLYAPEAGKLWYLYFGNAASNKDDANEPVYIKLQINGQDITLSIDVYSYYYYGMMGILLTNPDDPLNGRIYLFAHQKNADISTKFLERYSDETSVPLQFSEAKNVEKGGWIGYMGNEGAGTGPHVHMEVYEYFQDIRYTNEDLSFVGSNDPSTLNTWNNSNNFRWCRVDPRTVFERSLFTYNETWDYADLVETAAVDTYKLIEERKRYVYFQPWIVFPDFRSEE